MTRRAIISVYRKEGIADLARGLAARGFEIVSTGGTAQELAKEGVKVTSISDVTGFPEILDGRVKTLHPKVHAGILAKRGVAAHEQALREQGVVARRRRGREPLSVRGSRGQGRALRGSPRIRRHRRPHDAAGGGQELRARGRGRGSGRLHAAPRAARPRGRAGRGHAPLPRPEGLPPHRALRGGHRRLLRAGRGQRRRPTASPRPKRCSRTGWPSPSRRCRTCATARTRISAPRSTATSAPRSIRWPPRARSRARSSRSTTSSTSTRPGAWSPSCRIPPA